MSFAPLGIILEMICASIKGSVAPSTLAAYSSAWLQWLFYLSSVGETPFSEYLILTFLNNLMSQSLSWAHVNKTLARISFFLKLHNHPACNTLFSIWQALKGYKKGFFHLDRKGVTPSILYQLCGAADTVCSSYYEANLFRAVFSILFFRALRISEVVPPNRYIKLGILFSRVWLQEGVLKCFIP